MKLAAGVNVIVPSAATSTVPPVTGMLCAVPGVKVVPLMLVIVKVSTSTSVSAVSGVKVIAEPSSATV